MSLFNKLLLLFFVKTMESILYKKYQIQKK